MNAGSRPRAGDGRAARLYCSGGPRQDAFGYSRAIRTGDSILVCGGTALVDGAVLHRGDPAGQNVVAVGRGLEAIAALGATDSDVTRTRIYVVDKSRLRRCGASAP